MSSTTSGAPWRARLASVLEGRLVGSLIIGLIAVNAIILGMEASPGRFGAWMPTLVRIDGILLAVFTVEILLRIVAQGRRFVRDPWNVFDFVVIGIALLPSGGALSVLRSLRILRALRLVSMVPSMRRVVAALLAALPGMGSIVALLSLVVYVAAVMATKLFGAAAPEFFGSLGKSLFTLFQIMTVEGWPDIAREVMASKPHAWMFFVAYLVLSTFTVLNLFIAVIVNAMQQQVETETQHVDEVGRDLAGRDAVILAELRELRAELAALRAERRA